MTVPILAAIAIAGSAMVALGGGLAAVRLRAGFAVQAAGATALGVAGALTLFGDRAVGAAFHSDIAPAVGSRTIPASAR